MQPPVPQLPPTRPRRRHAGARIIQKGGGGGGGHGKSTRKPTTLPLFPLTFQPSWEAEKTPRLCSQLLHARPLPAYIYMCVSIPIAPEAHQLFELQRAESHSELGGVGGGRWRAAPGRSRHTLLLLQVLSTSLELVCTLSLALRVQTDTRPSRTSSKGASRLCTPKFTNLSRPPPQQTVHSQIHQPFKTPPPPPNSFLVLIIQRNNPLVFQL